MTGTSTRNLDPSVFRPELASNLTLIIQGLVVLFVGADVLDPLALEPARQARGRRTALGREAVTTRVSAVAASRRPRASRAPRGRRGRDRASARSPSGSRCRRSSSARRCVPLVVGVVAIALGSPARSRRRAPARLAARSRPACSGSSARRSSRTHSSVAQPRRTSSSGSALFAADARLRDAAHLRRARRPLLRAQRRRQHRPRGDDADRARSSASGAPTRPDSLGARAPDRDAGRRRCSRSSTRSSRSTCAPTRSSAARRSTSSRSGSRATSSSTSTAPNGTPDRTSRAIPDVHDLATSALGGSSRQAFGDLNLMIWLVVRCSLIVDVRSSSSGRRSACGCAPSASTRARRTRSGIYVYGCATLAVIALRDARRRSAAPTSRSASCTRSTRT